ncbi:hypothetical protein EVJ58_g7636 [Rhodofomes roseus]|uniref:BTB domain-containing protein n=1 Tax=Rhodofomes roseus TaxID=34475 RepID=A0A4Y9Y2X9_9APHY|nr:hypothetical protein EVJ58_g7636 [Rhodofomes roseus]
MVDASSPNKTTDCADLPQFKAPYDRTDGDVILRSCDNISYRVHRIILMMASPVFADMFNLPQPSESPVTAADQLTVSPPAVVDLTEDGKTIRGLLDACYPFGDPILDDLDTARSVLEAAMKYEFAKATRFSERKLQAFVTREPLRVFAIACRLNFEEMAKSAAEQVHSQSLFKQGMVYVEELDQVPAGCFHRLLQYYRRRGQWQELKFCTAHAHGSKGKGKRGGKRRVSDAPPPFDSPEADVIITTSDNVCFRVQATFISMAAPGLADRLPARSTLDTNVKEDCGDRHVSVEEDSRTLAGLLQLCHPTATPDIPADDLDYIACLVHAARKYRVEKVIWLIKLLWPRYIPLDPFRTYFLASSYGWTSEARTAADVLLSKTIESIEGWYSPILEDIHTRPYYRILAYHAKCSAAISATGTEMTAWLDDDATKTIYCSNFEALLQRPSPQTIKDDSTVAKLVALILEKKCSSCPPPSRSLPHVAFCNSTASKVKELVEKVDFDTL